MQQPALPDPAFPAPFEVFEDVVRPDWIDSNGHMNLAYYVVLFDRGVEALFDALGYGPAMRAPSDHGPFAVETHTLYAAELLQGERARVRSQIIGADTKRIHVAHEMFRLRDGVAAAMQEVMYLNVDLRTRRVAPFVAEVRTRVQAAAASHAAIGRPAWLGRRVAMPG